MKLEKGKKPNTDLWEYKLTFTDAERKEVVFTKWERDLIDLCIKDGSTHGTLLSLYLFAKRIEEQENERC